MRFAAALVVACILLLIGVALFSPVLDVQQIRVARSDPRLDDELIQEALRPLFGQRMPLLEVKTIPPLLTSPLSGVGHAAVPDLASVTITKDYPSTLQMKITLKPVAYRLLIQNPDQKAPAVPKAGSGADFLTDDGMYVTYTPMQVPSGGSLPQLTIVDWGVRPDPWTKLLTPAFLKTISDTKAQLKSQFHLDATTTTVYLRAREFHLQTKNYALWFDIDSPVADQLKRYSIFLASAPPGSAKQYVDLRVPGKILYK